MRVLLAPVETAGVASATRDGLRRRGHEATLEVLDRHPFGWPADRTIGRAPARRAVAGLRAPFDYDVLHFQFGSTLCAFADAAWARAMRRPVVLMHYWGSDCRTRRVAERLFPARARLFGASDGAHDRTIGRRLRIASRTCAAALVSDLELAAYVKPHFRTVYVIPTPIALPALAEPAADPGEGPIVLHAPSNAAIKGTREIVAAVESLGRRRPLRLRTVSGVPRERVLEEIARADVVVDQLNSETSGVFALEAMALGKPVLCEYDGRWLAPFARATPLIGVDASTLEERLEQLCDDPALRERRGEAGREFVRTVHDSDHVASLLELVYSDARKPSRGLIEVTADGLRPLRWPAH